MAERGNLVALGSLARERRKELGLTQTELGDRLGWAQERVSLLENGKYGLPSLPQLCRLADGLELSFDDLLRTIGLEPVNGHATERGEHSGGSELSLNGQLLTMRDQMHLMEDRLHAAEREMERAQELRTSIREQRQHMAALLASCSDVAVSG